MQIVLACYNAGLGHVLDARNLARKRGGNPDSWKDVSACLKAKSDPTVAQDEVVKYGPFNSRQTLAFVDQVWSRYHVYLPPYRTITGYDSIFRGCLLGKAPSFFCG